LHFLVIIVGLLYCWIAGLLDIFNQRLLAGAGASSGIAELLLRTILPTEV